jgi:anti-sigma factor RsiW
MEQGIGFRLDHRWARNRMSDYLDDGLNPGQLQRLTRHLGECAECRRLLAGLTQIVDALHRLPAREGGPTPLALAASVRARIKQLP